MIVDSSATGSQSSADIRGWTKQKDRERPRLKSSTNRLGSLSLFSPRSLCTAVDRYAATAPSIYQTANRPIRSRERCVAKNCADAHDIPLGIVQQQRNGQAVIDIFEGPCSAGRIRINPNT